MQGVGMNDSLLLMTTALDHHRGLVVGTVTLFQLIPVVGQ